MSRQSGAAASSPMLAPAGGAQPSIERLRAALGLGSAPDIAHLPFVGADATAGAEAELQASVQGSRHTVDLPLAVAGSDFLANIQRRAAVGDTAPRQLHALERFLDANDDHVWDNSWVRFPRRLLGAAAAEVFQGDLRADKSDGSGRLRGDVHKFVVVERGIEYARVPISYLLKLALADAASALPERPEAVRKTGRRLLGHFLSDNTSPETCSFNVVSLAPESGGGMALAREAGRRFLLTQLLLAYANRRYELEATGQKASACHAPTPPVRQRELNELISDSFYRELFMNPCLSGWDRGEDKSAYMGLCHEVLSRSQLNGVKKLRDAGIILNNLVVMPSTSNLSLANNGVHVSVGSKRLTELMAAGGSEFGERDEKYFGDLAIKMMEHFLPLFVGTYTAAPYRLGFQDFHPEIALGFLPHELDYTHLRMLWRRWKGKANLRAFGLTFTPCGPGWIDKLLSSAFGLRGDWVPDFRLVDYLVFLLSTNTSPSLSGVLGNSDRLKRDLSSLGVFDARMSLYLLIKLREQRSMGFSGFESRQYSLFERFGADMGRAVTLQTLLCAFAYQAMVNGRFTHADIPDHPTLESERRQVIFDCAIGLPTFFVHQASGNAFLKAVLAHTRDIRPSRRYPGYLRVRTDEYRRGLIRLLRTEAPALIEALGASEVLDDLVHRIDDPNARASRRLLSGILDEAGAREPLRVEARTFNLAAERYYRGTLRQSQLDEALHLLGEEISPAATRLWSLQWDDLGLQANPSSYLTAVRDELVSDRLNTEEILRLISLILAVTVACEGGDA
jgi:hypothetical protein